METPKANGIDGNEFSEILNASISKTPLSGSSIGDLQGRELFATATPNVVDLCMSDGDNNEPGHPVTPSRDPETSPMDFTAADPSKMVQPSPKHTPSRPVSKVERQQKIEENLKLKAEKKAQKDAERLAKQKEKEQKEHERKLKKEKEDNERKEKQEKRDAEKKKKQDEMQVKLDEKRKKEDERKQVKEKQENRAKVQSQQFMSFFQKKPSPTLADKVGCPGDAPSLYPPLVYKPGMSIAPPRPHRSDPVDLSGLEAALLRSSPSSSPPPSLLLSLPPGQEQLLQTGGEMKNCFQSDYLSAWLRRGRRLVGKRRSKAFFSPSRNSSSLAKESSTSGEVAMVATTMNEASNDCIIVGEDGTESLVTDQHPGVADDNKAECLRPKLLQFRENHRPAYWGTWRKKSKLVLPRRPFGKDESVLDYEADSDDDWEEEEQGEDIASSENEEEGPLEEGPLEEEEDDDGFFVPHGYLSDGEGDGEDDSEGDEVGGGTVKPGYEKFTEKCDLWDAESARQSQPMKPVCIGCVWEGLQGPASSSAAGCSSERRDEQLLQRFKAILLSDGPSDPLKPPGSYAAKADGHSTATPGDGALAKTPGGKPAQHVPEEAMPELVKMVHRNPAGLHRMMRNFRIFWGRRQRRKEEGDSSNSPPTLVTSENVHKEAAEMELLSGISKRQLQTKIRQISVKEVRPPDCIQKFYVHNHILRKYAATEGSHLQQSVPTTPAVPVVEAMEEGQAVMDPPPLSLSPRKRQAMGSPLRELLQGRAAVMATTLLDSDKGKAKELAQENFVPPEKKTRLNPLDDL